MKKSKILIVCLIILVCASLISYILIYSPINALRIRAKMGSAAAQCELGLRYLSADGVAENDTEALLLLKKASNKGYAKAQTLIGALYFTGSIVQQDDYAAWLFWSKAAKQGDETAQRMLKQMENGVIGKPEENNLKRSILMLGALSLLISKEEEDSRLLFMRKVN